MNEWIVLIVGSAAVLASALAAILKQRQMRREVKKHVSIQVGDERIEIEARSADIEAAIKKLRENSDGEVIRHAAG